MRIASALFLVSLTGCSFDFASFGQGSGGAGATSTGAAPSTSSSTGAGPGATSSASGAGSGATSSSSGAGGMGASSSSSVASSSASGSGGGPVAYPPCDNRTDAFNSFPGNWNIIGNGTGSNGGQHAKLTASAQSQFVGASYDSTGPNNCVVEIDTQAFPSTGAVYVSAFRDQTKNFGINFDNGTKLVSAAGLPAIDAGGSTQALGFVLTNGKVYFVYRVGNAWHLFDSITRPGWIDDGQSTGVGFGLFSSQNGKDATFDNYNLTAVYPSDIGL